MNRRRDYLAVAFYIAVAFMVEALRIRALRLRAYVALLLAGLLFLSACAGQPQVITRTRTVTVKVPVYRTIEPPAWLLAPVVDPDEIEDVFVPVGHPDAVLSVTRAGLSQFWQLIDRPLARVEAWQAYAMAPAEGLVHD